MTGGGAFADWFNSELFTSSGEKPRWEVGRRVKYHFSPYDIVVGTITAVSATATGGVLFKEFQYTIVHSEDGYVDEGVFESGIIDYVY